MKWKIVVATSKNIYFAGQNQLVETDKEAKWFPSYDSAIDWSKDIVAFNMEGVTQIRFIAENYEII